MHGHYREHRKNNLLLVARSTETGSDGKYFQKFEQYKAKDLNEYRQDEADDWLEIIQEGLENEGICLKKFEPGNYRILCPKCDGGSTSEISLSITIDASYQHALYNCFRATCGWKGYVSSGPSDSRGFTNVPQRKDPPTKPQPNFQPLDDDCYHFFEARCISRDVVERNRIRMEIKGEKKIKFIGFPYYQNGEVINIKYRAVHEKSFHQVKGAGKIWYGLDDVEGCEEVIIVEGEMDKLALEVAGYKNVISVPDGAPAKVNSSQSDQADLKFSYLESSLELFENAKKIIFATDNDACGEALDSELVRRIGAWKCWKVKFPNNFMESISPRDEEYSQEEINNDAKWYRKDANEILMKDGTEILKHYVEDAEPYPVTGLVRFMDFFEEIRDRYLMKKICASGFSLGWPGLDKYYKVVPGELSVVSGVPNSGKSEWLDAVAVRLAEQYGWKIALASMEKIGWDHGRQLIEKHIRKPFFQHVHYAKNVPRMSPTEVETGLDWINEQFPLIQKHDDELPTIDWILEKAKLAVYRYGIRGLIIDPYNELDHERKANMSETEFVSKMLSKIKHFARNYEVHVWLVAHPRQLHDWKGEPPNLYDISGSAHFINKADAGIVVHRNWKQFKKGQKADDEDDDDQYLVSILIKKMRNKAAGRVGWHVLRYNPVDGTYDDPEAPSPVQNASNNGVTEKSQPFINGVKKHL